LCRDSHRTTDVAGAAVDHKELSRIGEALDELAKTDSDLAEIVDLKFFCGFSFVEIAALHGVAERDGPAEVGEGAHLPAPEHSRGSISVGEHACPL
jgi:ECF sigma factor